MKRTTETVLRAELALREKNIERATERRERANQATRDAHAAGVVAQQGVDGAIADRDRARAALAAYLGESSLGFLVDQAKERAETTGTHDPADLVPEGDSDVVADPSASAGSVPTELAARRRGIRKVDTVVDEGDEAPE